jgi:hypothetical protein
MFRFSLKPVFSGHNYILFNCNYAIYSYALLTDLQI